MDQDREEDRHVVTPAAADRRRNSPSLSALVGGVETDGVISIDRSLHDLPEVQQQGTPAHYVAQNLHTLACEGVENSKLYFPPLETHLVDLETSGRYMAASVFLIGCGMPLQIGDEWDFKMKLFLAASDLDLERVLEAYVGQLLKERPYSIAFNGDRFDWKMLREQWMAYGKGRLTYKKTLDLLPAYEQEEGVPQGEDHALLSFENAAFPGFKRKDHIPSEEVPAAWREFAEQADSTRLLHVIDHNLYDLVTEQALYLMLLGRDMKKDWDPENEVPF